MDPYATSPLALRSAPMARAYAALRFLEEIKADEIRNPLPIEGSRSRSRSRSRSKGTLQHHQQQQYPPYPHTSADADAQTPARWGSAGVSSYQQYPQAGHSPAAERWSATDSVAMSSHHEGYTYRLEQNAYTTTTTTATAYGAAPAAPQPVPMMGGVGGGGFAGPTTAIHISQQQQHQQQHEQQHMYADEGSEGRASGVGVASRGSPLAATRRPAAGDGDGDGDGAAEQRRGSPQQQQSRRGSPLSSHNSPHSPNPSPNARPSSSPLQQQQRMQRPSAIAAPSSIGINTIGGNGNENANGENTSPKRPSSPRFAQPTASSANRAAASAPTSPRGRPATTPPQRAVRSPRGGGVGVGGSTFSSFTLGSGAPLRSAAGGDHRVAHWGSGSDSIPPSIAASEADAEAACMSHAYGDFAASGTSARPLRQGVGAASVASSGFTVTRASSPTGTAKQAPPPPNSRTQRQQQQQQQPSAPSATASADGNGALLQQMLAELVHLRKDTNRALVDVAEMRRSASSASSLQAGGGGGGLVGGGMHSSSSLLGPRDAVGIRGGSGGGASSSASAYFASSIASNNNDASSAPSYSFGGAMASSSAASARDREPFNLSRAIDKGNAHIADHRAPVAAVPLRTVPMGPRDEWVGATERTNKARAHSATKSNSSARLGSGRQSSVATPTRASILRRDQTLQQRAAYAAAQEAARAEEEALAAKMARRGGGGGGGGGRRSPRSRGNAHSQDEVATSPRHVEQSVSDYAYPSKRVRVPSPQAVPAESSGSSGGRIAVGDDGRPRSVTPTANSGGAPLPTPTNASLSVPAAESHPSSDFTAARGNHAADLRQQRAAQIRSVDQQSAAAPLPSSAVADGRGRSAASTAVTNSDARSYTQRVLGLSAEVMRHRTTAASEASQPRQQPTATPASQPRGTSVRVPNPSFSSAQQQQQRPREWKPLHNRHALSHIADGPPTAGTGAGGEGAGVATRSADSKGFDTAPQRRVVLSAYDDGEGYDDVAGIGGRAASPRTPPRVIRSASSSSAGHAARLQGHGRSAVGDSAPAHSSGSGSVKGMTVAGVFDPISGREIPLPPVPTAPSRSDQQQQHHRDREDYANGNGADAGPSTPSVSIIRRARSSSDDVDAANDNDAAVRDIASVSPLTNTHQGEPSQSPARRDEELLDGEGHKDAEDVYGGRDGGADAVRVPLPPPPPARPPRANAEGDVPRQQQGYGDTNEGQPLPAHLLGRGPHDGASGQHQQQHNDDDGPTDANLPSYLARLCASNPFPPLVWLAAQLRRMLSHVASDDPALEGRHWLCATALLNSPPFVSSIVVPLLLEELCERPSASDAAGGGADAQRRQQLLCALIGLGPAAAAALPRLILDLVAGRGDSRLVAMAVRAVGGATAITALCAIVGGELPLALLGIGPGSNSGGSKGLASCSDVAAFAAAVRGGLSVTAKARCVAAYALGLAPAPFVGRTTVALIASDRLKGTMSLMRPAPEDEPLAGETIDRVVPHRIASFITCTSMMDGGAGADGSDSVPLFGGGDGGGVALAEAAAHYASVPLAPAASVSSDAVVAPRAPNYRVAHVFLDFEAAVRLMLRFVESNPPSLLLQRSAASPHNGTIISVLTSATADGGYDVVPPLRDFLLYAPDIYRNLLAMTMGPTAAALAAAGGGRAPSPLAALNVTALAEALPALLLDSRGVVLGGSEEGRPTPPLPPLVRGGDWLSLLASGKDSDIIALITNTFLGALREVVGGTSAAATADGLLVAEQVCVTASLLPPPLADALFAGLIDVAGGGRAGDEGIGGGLLGYLLSGAASGASEAAAAKGRSSSTSPSYAYGGGPYASSPASSSSPSFNALTALFMAMGAVAKNAQRHRLSPSPSAVGGSSSGVLPPSHVAAAASALGLFGATLMALDGWRLRQACCVGLGMAGGWGWGGDAPGSGQSSSSSSPQQQQIAAATGRCVRALVTCLGRGTVPPPLAAWALAQMGRGGVAVLVDLLGKPHMSVVARGAAARALGRLELSTMSVNTAPTNSGNNTNSSDNGNGNGSSTPSQIIDIVANALLEGVAQNCRSDAGEGFAADCAEALGNLLAPFSAEHPRGTATAATAATMAAKSALRSLLDSGSADAADGSGSTLRRRLSLAVGASVMGYAEASAYYKEVPVSPLVTALAPLLSLRPDTILAAPLAAIMAALAGGGGPHGEVLVGQWLLQSDWVSVRAAAARGLRSRGACVVRVLCSALRDPSALVRGEALLSLETIGIDGIFAVLSRRPADHRRQVLSSFELIVANAQSLPVNAGGASAGGGVDSPSRREALRFAAEAAAALSEAMGDE